MRVVLAILLALSCQTVLAEGFGAAQTLTGVDEPDFLPVEEAYRLEVAPLPSGQVRLYWLIADAYYMYQHRFAFSLQDETGEDIPVQAELPVALEKDDEFFGQVRVYYTDADILLTPARPSENATLKVTSQGCADAGLCYPPRTQYFRLDFTGGSAAPLETVPKRPRSEATATAAPATADTRISQLLYMLLLAFAGGAILNLMPCVFPVLSLKVLSFANSTDHDRHLQSWVYTAGVIASFVAVAALLIGLQQAGEAIGWGFQLQSPGFVIALAYLFIAMGLSLSGVIEFGTGLMNTGGHLAERGGLSGSFFTGVLAVVVASPCTAPFMGTALGFAVSQPPAIGLLVFAALGAGMAAPLLLFSYSGGARALMPRPGPWMETLKQFLAFPLYATALWLLWVAGRQTGVNTMTSALAGALMLALGLWLWNTQNWRRILAFACVALAVTLGAQRGLDPTIDNPQAVRGKTVWSDSEVTALREAGQPVFVDVTADWCITCIANETAVLFTDDMSRAFEDRGVVYMVADWTNHDPKIAALLERFGRTGIPLYILYPADPKAEPVVLPQILTKQIVLNALDRHIDKNSDVATAF